MHTARLEVWWYLVTAIQKSPNEVARIFHRDGSSILYALRKLHERAVVMNVVLSEETVGLIAKAVATNAAQAKSIAGLEASKMLNLGKAIGRNRRK
jgi:hypothetical protein